MGTIITAIASIITAVIGVAGVASTNKRNEEINAKNLAFNASEAEKQRQFEAEMSSTSQQRQIQDMIKAGVNPAIALGGATYGGASTPAGATATAPTPIPMQNPFASLGEMFSNMNQASQANSNNANADRTRTLTPKEVEQIEASTANLNALTAKVTEETKFIAPLQESAIALNQALKELNDSKTLTEETIRALNNAGVDLRNAQSLTEDALRDVRKQVLESEAERNLANAYASIQAGNVSAEEAKKLRIEVEKWSDILDSQLRKTLADAGYREKEIEWYSPLMFASIWTDVANANSIGGFAGGNYTWGAGRFADFFNLLAPADLIDKTGPLDNEGASPLGHEKYQERYRDKADRMSKWRMKRAKRAMQLKQYAR